MGMAEPEADEVVTPQPKKQKQELQQPQPSEKKALKDPRNSCYSSAYRKEETRARNDGCGKIEARERGRAAGQAALKANGFA